MKGFGNVINLEYLPSHLSDLVFWCSLLFNSFFAILEFAVSSFSHWSFDEAFCESACLWASPKIGIVKERCEFCKWKFDKIERGFWDSLIYWLLDLRDKNILNQLLLVKFANKKRFESSQPI